MTEPAHDDDPISKLEEGVNISANGDVKIKIRTAAATRGNGINVGGADAELIPEATVSAITAAEWPRITEGVARRQAGQAAAH